MAAAGVYDEHVVFHMALDTSIVVVPVVDIMVVGLVERVSVVEREG